MISQNSGIRIATEAEEERAQRIVAETIWGEARGEGNLGMQGVGSVIRNRALHPAWWGRDAVSVCLQPWQFSCRNGGDPNARKLVYVTLADPQFAAAMQIALRVIRGTQIDVTDGADSYFALTSNPPDWVYRASWTMTIGHHAFYRVRLGSNDPADPIAPTTRNRTADDLNAAELDRLHQQESPK